MHTRLRNIALISAVPAVLGIALATGLTWPRTVDSAPAVKEAAPGPIQKWTKVSVELPTSQTPFPPGDGAVIANAYCLICHSAGMVLRQPPLTQDEWVVEINKMRNSFGAPLPADQVAALAKYLRTINGRQSAKEPSAVDGQSS
jgi:mono/diheme cytochrome c family protein